MTSSASIVEVRLGVAVEQQRGDGGEQVVDEGAAPVGPQFAVAGRVRPRARWPVTGRGAAGSRPSRSYRLTNGGPAEHPAQLVEVRPHLPADGLGHRSRGRRRRGLVVDDRVPGQPRLDAGLVDARLRGERQHAGPLRRGMPPNRSTSRSIAASRSANRSSSRSARAARVLPASAPAGAARTCAGAVSWCASSSAVTRPRYFGWFAVLLPERPDRLDLRGDRVVGDEVGRRPAARRTTRTGRWPARRRAPRSRRGRACGSRSRRRRHRGRPGRAHTFATCARSRATSAWLSAALVSIWTLQRPVGACPRAARSAPGCRRSPSPA